MALGQSWPRGAYEQLFREAVAAQPTYGHFYLHKARFLLPRWFGEVGEWQRFAAETKVARGGELYALICWAQGQVEGYPQLFSVHGIAWADVKAGYAEMLRRSSRSPWVQNCMARLALDAGDRETAARMFEEIGADYYSSAWKSRAMFEDYRAKALGVRAGDTILPGMVPLRMPGLPGRTEHAPPGK